MTSTTTPPTGEGAARVTGAAAVERAMVTTPKTLLPTATVDEAVEGFTDHVHMLLVVGDDGRLLATLCREDLADVDAADAGSPVLPWGRLEGRTVRAGTSLTDARSRLEDLGVRRVAVVDADDRLLGLLCLKRHRGGYCSDAGVRARAAGA